MATCNVNTLMASAAPFGSLSSAQLQLIEIALLVQILQSANPTANVSVNALMESAKCFACLSPGEWKIIELQLLCEILNA